MKCSKCNKEDPKCINAVCNSCRLKKWRKDNPGKVKDYAKMRQVRDKKKIKIRQEKSRDRVLFGGNRIKALERDNYECQNCSMTQEQNIVLFGRSITVHHIDGNGRGCENPNNDMDNLITLCFRCHPKADLGRIDFSSLSKQEASQVKA